LAATVLLRCIQTITSGIGSTGVTNINFKILCADTSFLIKKFTWPVSHIMGDVKFSVRWLRRKLSSSKQHCV